MGLPDTPEIQQPSKKMIGSVVFYFASATNQGLSPSDVSPVRIDGAEVSDFKPIDYVLFRARFDEVESSRGNYKKKSERGYVLVEGILGMRLEYARVEESDLPTRINLLDVIDE